MEKLLMYTGILSGIILAFVGIIKLPFIRFKEKKFYKPLFTILTILLVLGACIVCELYIIKGTIFSLNMLCLTLMTLGGTMVTYNGLYEGLGIKGLFKKLFTHIKELLVKSPESKLTKQAEKMGIVQAIDYLNKKLEESKPVEETKTEETKVEVVKVETATDRTIIKGV